MDSNTIAESKTDLNMVTEPGRSSNFYLISVVLLVAAACAIVGVVAATRGNWAIVVSEIPSVIGLLLVASIAQTAANGSAVAKAATAVGIFCLVEAVLLTLVFDVRGTALLVVLAVSTAAVIAGLFLWWAYQRQQHQNTN